MLGLAVAAVVITGLGDRPEVLTGKYGQPAYKAKLEQYLNLDGITVRREWVFGNCSEVTYISDGFEPFVLPNNRSSIDFFTNEAMSGAGEDILIAVKEKVVVRGCGKTYRHNFLAWHDRRNTLPNMAFLRDGETIASIDAQFKASSLAFDAMQAMRRAKGPDNCQQLPLLYDTRIEGRPETGGWSEIWSMALCDVKHDFRMTFTPANGTVTVKSELIR